jgi:osmotically-inducible protein OsmY
MSIRTESSWRPGVPWRPSEHKGRGFAGRGPRGYTRPDARIREDVCDGLTAHDEIDASEIEVTVLEGEVTLTGTVDDAVAKALAEATAATCRGVRRVRSRLWIRQEERGTAPEAGTRRAD